MPLLPPIAHLWRPTACLIAAALTYGLAPDDPSLRSGLTLFVLIGSLWLTEALHLSVTALLVPLLAVLAGLFTPAQALAAFAHPIIFLFLGGFALAAALTRHGLDRLLAAAMLRLAGGAMSRATLMLFGLVALLSMWISNTAATAMMLPLALGLLRSSGTADVRTQAFVLLGLAYSASIGGIATLVGSPPNAIAAAQAGIGFAQWLRIGLPVSLLLWPVMIALLWLLLRPQLSGRVSLPPVSSSWTPGRWAALVIFSLTVAAWVGGVPLARWLGVSADMDTLIALAAIVALCASRTVAWSDIERTANWGVLLLFGGGLALSQLMSHTGTSRFLADQLLALVQHAPTWLLLLGVTAFVVFLTELVSNTASAALLIPILLGVAETLGLPPVMMAALVAIGASCAFMLPVATPPNALVFGTGEVTQATMMRCGVVLNLACIAFLAALLPRVV